MQRKKKKNYFKIYVLTCMDLTRVISEGLSVFKACILASKAGIAFAKSLSHSYLIAWDSAAASLATASSADTTYKENIQIMHFISRYNL